MTPQAPMAGRDTAAAFRGLIIGALAIAAVVLALVVYTNNKYAGHEESAATEATH